ncbi:rod shape-determining protein MreC [Candidatus Microgenomates bacterium]|nr:rod shape-determining protein MreC [Candidatus Microgenomates bacterium]
MKTLELRTFSALFLIAIFIFLVDNLGLLYLPKSALQFVILPVQYTFVSAKKSGEETFSFLTFWRSGEARIKNLEQRNRELQLFESQVKLLRAENDSLRTQLGVKPTKDRKTLPAVVLGNGRYLEIGVGANDGVVEGQNVVYAGNLVGIIVRVNPRSSFVQLPIDPQSRIPVKVNKARGLSSGQFNSSIMLDRVAQTEDFSVGDFVYTSGDENKFDAGLVVGKVTKIVSVETDLFRKAEIVPLINYSELSTVFVLQ